MKSENLRASPSPAQLTAVTFPPPTSFLEEGWFNTRGKRHVCTKHGPKVCAGVEIAPGQAGAGVEGTCWVEGEQQRRAPVAVLITGSV